jgi:hypothetical protein
MKTQRTIGMAAVVVVAGLLGACTKNGAQTPPPTASTAPAAAPTAEPGDNVASHECPMQIPGTTVTSSNVEGGVALAFTTNGGDVAELRERVQRMTETHHQHHTGGVMGMAPPSTASSEDIEGGARLVLKPQDPAQLEALREHARTHAARMAEGDCPMMSRVGDATSATAGR